MNREELLTAMAAMTAAAVEAPRKVEIQGLGTVHVREVTIGEIDRQMKDTADGSTIGMARGVCRVLSDEHGNRLLDPEDPEDVAKIAKLPIRVLQQINATVEEIDKGN